MEYHTVRCIHTPERMYTLIMTLDLKSSLLLFLSFIVDSSA
jgi:hypothetical protein